MSIRKDLIKFLLEDIAYLRTWTDVAIVLSAITLFIGVIVIPIIDALMN